MTDPNAQTPARTSRRPPSPLPRRRPPPPPLSHEQDIQWGSFAHLGGVLGFLPSLIIWIVFKDRGSFTDTEAKEALNFQITLAFGYVISSILMFVFIGAILCGRLDPRRRVLGHRVPAGQGRQPLPLPVRDPPHQVGDGPAVSPARESFTRGGRCCASMKPTARRRATDKEPSCPTDPSSPAAAGSAAAAGTAAAPAPAPRPRTRSATPQLNPSDEKLWATLIHIGGIFFSFVPALIGYLVLKDRGPFIREHTATALNFQITMAIAYVISYVLWLVVDRHLPHDRDRRGRDRVQHHRRGQGQPGPALHLPALDQVRELIGLSPRAGA